MAKLLEAKPIAEKIRGEIELSLRQFKTAPILASVLVGQNPGALAYISAQEKTADSLGITYKLFKLSQDTAENELINFVLNLNSDKEINGIILQMPLPVHIDYKKVREQISEQKDVEGMHPLNMGHLILGRPRFSVCTATAVMELLNSTGMELYGKEVVIVGASEIVGKPLALLLLEKFATVTVCHIGTSKAGRLKEHVSRAEVLIVAVGKAGLIKGEWIKKGAVVIDVGINRLDDKIVGDVDFPAAEKRAGYITPVPGGVGPLTALILMRNLITATKLQL